jgi:hypothetical protein
VAGAPDLLALAAVLNRAVQVSARGPEGAPLGFVHADQQHRLGPEPHDAGTIRSALGSPRDRNFVDGSFRHAWGAQKRPTRDGYPPYRAENS